MWFEYIHHLLLQIPGTGTIGLAIIAVIYVKKPAENLEQLLRLLGWLMFFVTTLAAFSGIMSAPGILGGNGPEELSHHRNFGVMVFLLVAASTIGFEIGIRSASTSAMYIKKAASLIWIGAAVSAFAAGHWGGSVVHSDQIPWDQSPPIIEKLKK